MYHSVKIFKFISQKQAKILGYGPDSRMTHEWSFGPFIEISSAVLWAEKFRILCKTKNIDAVAIAIVDTSKSPRPTDPDIPDPGDVLAEIELQFQKRLDIGANGKIPPPERPASFNNYNLVKRYKLQLMVALGGND